jgi:hypothetical protein
METRHFLRRAKKRNLFSKEQESVLKKIIQQLGPKLNAYIKSIRVQSRKKTQSQAESTND